MCWQLARDCQIPSLSRHVVTDGRTVELAVWGTEKPHTHKELGRGGGGEKKSLLSKRLRTDGCAIHLKHLLRVRGRGISSAEQTLLNSFSCNEKTLKNRVIYVLQMGSHVIRCVQKHSPFLCVSCLCRPKRSAVFDKHQTRITSAASHALKAVFLKSPAKRWSPRRRHGRFSPIYPQSPPT